MFELMFSQPDNQGSETDFNDINICYSTCLTLIFFSPNKLSGMEGRLDWRSGWSVPGTVASGEHISSLRRGLDISICIKLHVICFYIPLVRITATAMIIPTTRSKTREITISRRLPHLRSRYFIPVPSSSTNSTLSPSATGLSGLLIFSKLRWSIQPSLVSVVW